MLNVNSTSSAIGGSGRITIASAASTPTGTPMPERSSDLKSSVCGAVAAMKSCGQFVKKPASVFRRTPYRVQLPSHGLSRDAGAIHSLETSG